MQTSAAALQSLDELKTGERAFLREIHADRAVVCRLTSLGFTPGVEIQMIQNYGRGPLVVTVRGARVALGRREAHAATILRGEA